MRQKLALLVLGSLLACGGLLLVEWTLALSGVAADNDPYVGFEPGRALFERRQEKGRKEVYATAKAKLRFFNPQRFAAHKAPGTVRIFTLGGSTTYGRPYDHQVSFSKYLELLLQTADTRTRYEVINAGGISYASYRLVILFQELLRYEADVVVIYTGHNEFLEERTYRPILRDRDPPWLRNLKERLSRLRIFTLLRRLLPDHSAEHLPGEVQARLDVKAGLEAFHRDDELKRNVLSHFRFNIDRLVRMAQERGVNAVLVTPASNIKDFSPFKSEHRPGLTSAQRDAFAIHVQHAAALLVDRGCEAARPVLERAVAVDDEYASAQFQLGRCLLETGEVRRAEGHLLRAVEFDVCPLRALEEIQAAVTDVATRRGVPLIDLPAVLREESTMPVLGEEHFLDHVHPTVEVHQRLAELILVALIQRRWVPAVALPTEARRARLYRAQLTTLGEPYFARRDLNLGKVLGWAGKEEEAARAFARAIKAMPDNPEARYNLGVVHERSGRLEDAAGEYRHATRLRPDYFQAHFNLGKVYQQLARHEQAAASLELALALEPDDPATLFNLGATYSDLGRHAAALGKLEAAETRDGALPGLGRALDIARERQRSSRRALADDEAAVADTPDDAEAHNALGVAYGSQGLLDQAQAAFARSVALDPTLAAAHRNLALLHQQRGELGPARARMETVVKLQPNNARHHFEFGVLHHGAGDLSRAVEAFRKAVALDPRFARAYNNLGAVYAKVGRPSDAIKAFRKAVQIDPGSADAHYNLAGLYLDRDDTVAARRHYLRARALGIKLPAALSERIDSRD